MDKPVMYSGIHAVESLLRHRPEAVLELFVLDRRAERGEARLDALMQQALAQGIAVQSARRESLEKLAGPQNQGVVARARPRVPGGESELAVLLDGLERPPLLLILEGVTDPHNLGACLRSADAAGVDASTIRGAVRKADCQVTDGGKWIAVGAVEYLDGPVIAGSRGRNRWCKFDRQRLCTSKIVEVFDWQRVGLTRTASGGCVSRQVDPQLDTGGWRGGVLRRCDVDWLKVGAAVPADITNLSVGVCRPPKQEKATLRTQVSA
ncbi:MAG: hypothetical protein COB00_19150, partial [Alcanivorax sp.]